MSMMQTTQFCIVAETNTVYVQGRKKMVEVWQCSVKQVRFSIGRLEVGG